MKMAAGVAKIKSHKLVSVLVLVAVAAGISLVWHIMSNKPANVQSSTAPPLTNKLIKTSQLNAADASLSDKNYKQAALNYINASSSAAADGNYQGAKNILEEGINKIPDKYLGWTYFDALSAIDSQLNDKKSALSDLQKALQKAEQNNPKANQETIDSFKTTIKQLESQNAGT